MILGDTVQARTGKSGALPGEGGDGGPAPRPGLPVLPRLPVLGALQVLQRSERAVPVASGESLRIRRKSFK